MHMTVRITVSLPDDVHADLLRVAGASNVSASAVVRAMLSDLLPKVTGVLDFLQASPPITPDAAGAMVNDLDAWMNDLRGVLHEAPPALGGFRNLLDDTAEKGDES